jgi:hypothetical protein
VGNGEADTAAGEAEGEAVRTSLTLCGDLSEADLDALCAELLDSASPTLVDLSRLGGLEPATLAVIVSSLRRLRGDGIFSTADVVPCAEPASCLDEPALIELEKPEGGVWKRCGQNRILGWQAFASGGGALAAALSVARLLQENTSWPTSSYAAMSALAFELGENVRQHSASPEGVLALEADGADERIRVAIADAGIGIRASLARNPAHANLYDDLTAIERAVSPGGTGEPGAGGGMGLYLTRVMVRGNGGRVFVRSGEASWEEGDERRRLRRLPPLSGTLIGIEARTDEPLHDGEVWARSTT